MTAEEYKALIRQAMPLARSRGDVDVYSNVRFEDLATAPASLQADIPL